MSFKLLKKRKFPPEWLVYSYNTFTNAECNLILQGKIFKNLINVHTLISNCKLEKNAKINKHACTLIWKGRVWSKLTLFKTSWQMLRVMLQPSSLSLYLPLRAFQWGTVRPCSRGIKMAALLTSVRTSWKVPIHYKNWGFVDSQMKATVS